jgi:hypothetical protein
MAVMIPAQPLDFHGSGGEAEVFDALRELDPRCYVFHSVRWLRRADRWSAAEGEGDFVVFDPQRGLLVLEVKSGGIRFQAGRWHQLNRSTGVEREMQDPEAQANRTRYHLLDQLKNKLGPNCVCPVYHAVWFPSVDFPKKSLPLNYQPSMILDRANLRAAGKAIDTAFAFGSGKPRTAVISTADSRRIVEMIAPDLYAALSMRHALEARERAFIRLTEEQGRVLDFLEEQPRAVVAGAAGTGKTMVALQLARRLADAGQKVSFLCFNGPLRKFLQAHHGAQRITFDTFDSLAADHLGGHSGDFEGARTAFLELLSSPDAPSFAHVIIDEGQDFVDEWIDFLESCTTGTFYVFYDRNQLVQRDAIPRWIERADCRLVLRRNCRTTTQIARTAYLCAATPLKLPADSVDGPKPRFYACTTRNQAAVCIASVLMKLLEQDLEPHEIAILTLRTPETSVLGPVGRLGAYALVDTPKKGCVTYSTVRRFKGLEARAVVLLDVQPGAFTDPSYRNLLYVGASRAMHELHVVFDGGTTESIAAAAKAMVPDGRKANPTVLASVLGVVWDKEGANAEIVDE